jgi:hypothetical protein
MDPDDDGWRYHDPHGWHGGYHHHYGPPPGMHDDGFPFLPVLFTLMMLLWLVHRTYGLDTLVGRLRTAVRGRPDPVRPRWDDAVTRHAETARAYAAFECDPAAVLHRPALADVGEPATGRFVDAFAEATALGTDAYPGPDAGERFVLAA